MRLTALGAGMALEFRCGGYFSPTDNAVFLMKLVGIPVYLSCFVVVAGIWHFSAVYSKSKLSTLMCSAVYCNSNLSTQSPLLSTLIPLLYESVLSLSTCIPENLKICLKKVLDFRTSIFTVLEKENKNKKSVDNFEI